jgi:hypothetical protein
VLPFLNQFVRMGYLLRRQFRLTPEFHAPALRGLHPSAGSFADQAAL